MNREAAVFGGVVSEEEHQTGELKRYSVVS